MIKLRISQLTAASALAGTEQFEVTQSSNSRSATALQLKTYLEGAISTIGTLAVTGPLTLSNALTLASGTTVLAPVTLQSGTNLTTPVSGAVEWNGTHLFVTQASGPTRKTLAFTDSSITGNAATASALTPGATINGVSFTGSTAITVTAAAGTLTGATLASGVTASSLTSVGALTALTVSGNLAVDTNTLFVDAANNAVGIGTTVPIAYLAKLAVEGNISVGSGAKLYQFDAVNGSGRYMQALVTSGLSIGKYQAGGDDEQVRIDSNGNLAVDTTTLFVDAVNNRVGVNTASPATTHDVNGATTLRGSLTFLADATHDIGASGSARPRTIYAATSVVAPVVTENGSAVVSQADVGTSANEIPLNQMLGTLAFQDAVFATVDQLQRRYEVLADNTAAQGLGAVFASQVGISADTTLTTTVPPAGTEAQVILVSVGTTSRTVTFGSGFASTGTVTTGTAAARRFVLTYISDGTRLLEVSRTTAITV